MKEGLGRPVHPKITGNGQNDESLDHGKYKYWSPTLLPRQSKSVIAHWYCLCISSGKKIRYNIPVRLCGFDIFFGSLWKLIVEVF